ncbi:hypothetical protein GCM10027174_01900 [Salinifilum aidingensis]
MRAEDVARRFGSPASGVDRFHAWLSLVLEQITRPVADRASGVPNRSSDVVTPLLNGETNTDRGNGSEPDSPTNRTTGGKYSGGGTCACGVPPQDRKQRLLSDPCLRSLHRSRFPGR